MKLFYFCLLDERAEFTADTESLEGADSFEETTAATGYC